MQINQQSAASIKQTGKKRSSACLLLNMAMSQLVIDNVLRLIMRYRFLVSFIGL